MCRYLIVFRSSETVDEAAGIWRLFRQSSTYFPCFYHVRRRDRLASHKLLQKGPATDCISVGFELKHQ